MTEVIICPVGVVESDMAKCSWQFQGLIAALKAIFHTTAQQPVHSLKKKISYSPAITKMKSPCKVKRKKNSLVSVTEAQENTEFQKHRKEGSKEAGNILCILIDNTT